MPLTSNSLLIAEAVKAVIDGAGLVFDTNPVVAEQVNLPAYDLEDVQALKVVVVPSAWAHEPSTRGATAKDHGTDVGILGAVDPDDLDSVDAYAKLAEDIADLLSDKGQRELTIGSKKASWTGSEVTAPYDVDSMRENKQFLTVITATYQVID